MVTREQILRHVRKDQSYAQIGAELGVRPGLAYLVATGLPADGSAAIAPEDRERAGFMAGSTQHLSNPPAHNPTVKPEILTWMSERAGRDLSVPAKKEA